MVRSTTSDRLLEDFILTVENLEQNIAKWVLYFCKRGLRAHDRFLANEIS